MFQLPDPESPEAIADWIELELAAGVTHISKARVSSVLQAETGSEPGEPLLSDVWGQLEERQARYSRGFFSCWGDLVRRSGEASDSPEYVACLLFSLYGVCDQYRADPKIFERLAAVAIRNYVQGRVFLFGWPVLPDVQTDIALRVKNVAAAVREKFVEAPAARYKDRGVDVIAWRPFPEHFAGEHRSNQIVILAQCAAGANWRQKTGQLPYSSWTQYMHWACDPLQGFAVPGVVPTELWHDISREAGILFDRIRIVNLLPHGVGDPELSAAIETWTSQALEESKA